VQGSGDALRRLVDKLDRGEPAVVAALGGSVTRGHGGGPFAGERKLGHPGSWSRLVYDYIKARWPHADHAYANGAVPATGAPACGGAHACACTLYAVQRHFGRPRLRFCTTHAARRAGARARARAAACAGARAPARAALSARATHKRTHVRVR
jgi:hypothetical protein